MVNLILILLMPVTSCTARQGGLISRIDFEGDSAEFNILQGEIVDIGYFKISTDADFSYHDMEFVSEDENVALLSYEKSEDNKIYCKVKAVNISETYVYVRSKIGEAKSDKIKVVVSAAINEIAVDETAVSLYTNGEPYNGFFTLSPSDNLDAAGRIIFVSDDENIAEIYAAEGELNTSPYKFVIVPKNIGETTLHLETADGLVHSSNIKVTVTESDCESKDSTKSIQTVFITPSGKKYHLSAGCAGKNSYAVDISEATNDGKEPCKRCAAN